MAPAMTGTLEDLRDVAPEWNALAARAASPFTTVEWLTSWWEAFGEGEPEILLERDANGRLRAGASCMRSGRRLTALSNVHSGDWDVVAADEAAHAAMWGAIAGRE